MIKRGKNMIYIKSDPQYSDSFFKYYSNVFTEELHIHLELEGKYKKVLSPNLVREDGTKLEADFIYAVELPDNQLGVNIIEHQSTSVHGDKMERIAEYRNAVMKLYGAVVTNVIIITVNPKNSIKRYKITPSDYLEPIYIHKPWEEIQEELNNLKIIYKKHTFNRFEASSFAFIPLYAPKDKGPELTQELCKMYSEIKFDDEIIARHTAILLRMMIYRNFKHDKKKEKELCELINMTECDNALKELTRDLYKEDYERQEERIRNYKEDYERQEERIRNYKVENERKDERIRNYKVENERKGEKIRDLENQVHNLEFELDEYKSILQNLISSGIINPELV